MKNLTENRFDHLSLFIPAVIYSCLPSGNFPPIFISQSVTRLMGYQPSEFINTPNFWADHIHPDEREEIFKNLENLFVYDKHSHIYRFKLSDGTYKWFQDDLTLIRNDVGDPVEVFGCMVDISQKKLFERENLRIEIEKRLINERLIFIQDMHDGFGSQLALAQLKIREEAFDKLDILNIINDCISDLHLICDNLAQPNLSLQGSLSNLKYRLDRLLVGSYMNLEFHIDLTDQKKNLPEGYVLNILRILQEAITNAIRHSKGDRIVVTVKFNKSLQQYIFTVKDNGIGMANKVEHGRGLNNIQARLKKIGGDFKISNANGVELSFIVNN